MSTSLSDQQQLLSVGMAEIKLARHPDGLFSVLGSCIGVAIVDIRSKTGTFAHVVLPESNGRSGPPGKFADTAIPQMLEMLQAQGVSRRGLMVKLTGGAQMFSTSGPMQIGTANADAVRKALRAAGLAVQAQDIGGEEGRRVTLDVSTGELTICRVSQPELTI